MFPSATNPNSFDYFDVLCLSGVSGGTAADGWRVKSKNRRRNGIFFRGRLTASVFLRTGGCRFGPFQENHSMRLAKIIFLVAGIWGVLVLTPLYF
jgi:hypothetical protein